MSDTFKTLDTVKTVTVTLRFNCATVTYTYPVNEEFPEQRVSSYADRALTDGYEERPLHLADESRNDWEKRVTYIALERRCY